MELKNYKQTTEQCAKCPLYSSTFVPWQLVPEQLHKGVMLVGEAPGETEIIIKRPFVGSSGKLLWRLLNGVGINKDDLVITNVVACRPPDNRTPSSAEMSYCSNRLMMEIAQVKPKLIVALGEPAMKTLTDQTGIQKKRGEIFPLSPTWNHKCDVLCVLHPSFVMRQRQWIQTTAKDLKLISDCQEGVMVKNDYTRPPFVLQPTATDLSAMLSKMSKAITAVDIETPSELDILTASVIGIAFYAGDEAVGLDFTSKYDSDVWNVVKHFQEDNQAKKCTQNGQFDWGVLESNGIKSQGMVFDTLLAEHTMNSDLPGNLDFLRGRYTKIKSYKPDAKAMKRIANWSESERLEYNCWDVVATWEVMQGQKKQMNESQMRVLTELEIPLVDVCNYMERKGILVDVNVLALTNAAIQPKIKELEQKYFDQLNLNPRSPLQLKKLFNIPSTGRDELTQHIRRGHKQKELMQAVLDYRDMDKISSVYLIGIYNKLRKNRIHAHPKIEGTGTGRLSYQKPNLQNIPKNFRNIFIPDSPEHCLIESDYSQLELRVAALIAPEPTMLKFFAEGKRIHNIIGEQVYGKKWEDLTPHENRRAKAVVFGTIYGRTARSLAMEHNVTVREAERWQNICLKNYPGLMNYISAREEEFRAFRRVTTVFGRIRFLQTPLQAFNTPIQSAASDVTVGSIISLYKAGFDVRCTVHDSVLIHCREKDKIETIKAAEEIMQRPVKEFNGYRFPVKSEVGKNWRDLEEIK
jgi:uracil-DNA glycosylase family 4